MVSDILRVCLLGLVSLKSLLLAVLTRESFVDFAAFSEPEYDLPIFYTNAFTTPTQSIVVL